jgi:hypothetical protein
MSLKYSKDAVIKGFTGIPNQFKLYGEDNTFADAVVRTPEQRVNEINAMANNCRWGNEPIFADETQFLPVNKDSLVKSGTVTTLTAKKPEPPKKAQDDTLVNAVLIGVGVFVLYKLLS